MTVQASKVDLNKHERYNTTTITISRQNHKALQQLALEGQSFNQLLTQILKNKHTIIKLLIEEHQKKLEALGGSDDDHQSATDTNQEADTDQIAENR
jgi:hypothetical protein